MRRLACGAARGRHARRLHVDRQHRDELGRVVHRQRFLPAHRAAGPAASATTCGWAVSVRLLIFALSMFVAYYFVQGLRAWFLFINSVVFAFILPLSWLRFFWWRLNIYGEAAALIIGLAAQLHRLVSAGIFQRTGASVLAGISAAVRAGLVTSIVVSLLTRPEPIETHANFMAVAVRPGFGDPWCVGFQEAERAAIRGRRRRDLLDCALGVHFATACIVAVVSAARPALDDPRRQPGDPGRSGGLFIRRWARAWAFSRNCRPRPCFGERRRHEERCATIDPRRSKPRRRAVSAASCLTWVSSGAAGTARRSGTTSLWGYIRPTLARPGKALHVR